MTIRNLTAEEVECRALRVDKSWCQLTLYKDARCDMKILDELFTPFGWERKHETINGNLFCTVSVYDHEKGQWISKQDVGTESRTEKEKGEASDAFKRACTNIGIGRELYTQPPIFINLGEKEVDVKRDRNENEIYSLKRKVSFRPAVLEVNGDKAITKLVIVDQDGIERFGWEKRPLNEKIEKDHIQVFYKLMEDTHTDQRRILNYIGKKFYCEIKSVEELTIPQWIYGTSAMEEKKKKPVI